MADDLCTDEALDRLVTGDRRHGRTILADTLVAIHQLTPEWPRDSADARRITGRLVTNAWCLHQLAGGTGDDIEATVDHRLSDAGQGPHASPGWPTVAERGQTERERRTDGQTRSTDPHRQPGPATSCPLCGASSPPGYVVHRDGCTGAVNARAASRGDYGSPA